MQTLRRIEAEDMGDEHRVSFQILYGISETPHASWSMANARSVIGDRPQDKSEMRFADVIAEHMCAMRSDDGGRSDSAASALIDLSILKGTIEVV